MAKIKLNPAQREAVHTLSGPLLVLAGAGTGKTGVVTCRIAELIESGVEPDRILAVTFTNKAAREMLQRAKQLLGRRSDDKEPEISTFHSLCLKILRRQITHLGYPRQFGICDQGDQEGFVRAALREIISDRGAIRPGDILSIISNWKNACVTPQKAIGAACTDREHLAASVYRRYQDSLKTCGLVDFDDLLMLTETLFQKFPKIRREEAERFDQLLVDEYQDTNGSQYRVIKALAGRHRNLCVVGDDDQSIYGWRGAEVKHILRFRKDWPEAKVVRLETNYRSTHEIVNLANRVIAFNNDRHEKALQAVRAGVDPEFQMFDDEMEEAIGVVSRIRLRIDKYEKQPSDFAILVRANDQTKLFEAELRSADVPYVVIGGSSFFDRKEVRDLLAYMKIMANPRDDVSLLRVINTPPRGIGQQTTKQLLTRAVAKEKPVWDELQNLNGTSGIADKPLEALKKFKDMINGFRQRAAAGATPFELFEGILRTTCYVDEIERNYANQNERDIRWDMINSLEEMVREYTRRSVDSNLIDFLRETSLDMPSGGDEKDKKMADNAVVLITMHAAKGLEFPEVFIPGLEEGILPHKKSLADFSEDAVAEERRLCYVAVTRAKNRLLLTRAKTRKYRGKQKDTRTSRFYYEMTEQTDNPRYWEVQKPEPKGRAKKKVVKKKKRQQR